MSELHRLETLPAGFLDSDARELYRLLPGPSLIHLSGQDPARLFVTILQHGNEDTGLKAVQTLLKSYSERPLPRGLSLFIANVQAARYGQRRLDGQPDYNRIWPGGQAPPSAERQMMQSVLDEMRHHALFACIDLHNNTGLNPHYAAICALDNATLQLATLFGRIVLYFTQPKGVLVQAFAPLCPSVVLECGRVGNSAGTQHAYRFLDACLHMDHLPQQAPPAHDLDLFHTVAQVKLHTSASLGFGQGDEDLLLPADLDHLNFRELPAGTLFGRLRDPRQAVLCAEDEHGADVTARFFHIQDRQIRLKTAVMPSMLTLDERIIRQDCLCYFMERVAQ